MNKRIDAFQITGITLSGFKCFKEEISFTFGNPTVITGGNGRGKSSLADAIAYALTGLPFFGESGLDRLYNDGTKDASVTLYITDGNGESHQLTRSRRNDKTTIVFDGRDIRQYELTEVFGEKDVILSILNPLYFIEELGDDGKKLLERYLPTITHEQILACLSDSVREALEKENILSPDAFLQKCREDIREAEKSVIYLSGQKDLAAQQAQEKRDKLSELSARLNMLREEAEVLTTRRFEGLDLEAMREELVDCSARYDELARDMRDNSGESERSEKLNALHRQLGEKRASQYEPKYTQAIAEKSAKIKELAAKYKREKALLEAFAPGAVCPTCHRQVTEADISVVQTELRRSITAAVSDGKAQRSQLDELISLEEQTKETFRQFREDDIARIESEIAGLSEAPADNAERDTELTRLRSRIQELTSDLEYGKLEQGEYDRLQECIEQQRECEAELSALARMETGTAVDCDERIAGMQQFIQEKKRLLSDIASYMSKRADMLFSKLSMNKVKISLFDVVKATGEAKDVFKFTYDGRRYDRLSLSEKVRAGMEVSELMKRLSGRNYPVFADNMESVEDLANVRPTGQVIMAKCVHGAALTVKPVRQVQIPKAA